MRIVIVGIGKVGRALAEHLSREGHDVAVIDNRPGMAERLAEELDVLGIEGNGAAYTVQQQARASQADLVIAATSEDEVNMIACMTAKKLGAKNATVIYTVIALVFIFLGTVMSNDLVWELTDMFNNLMVIPNVIALFALTKMVVGSAESTLAQYMRAICIVLIYFQKTL